MPREVSSDFFDAYQGRVTSVAAITLLTFTHPEMSDPIRVCDQPEADVVSRGETYLKSWFNLEPPGDDDGPPQGRLTFQNVDKRIGAIIRRIQGPIELKIEWVLSSDPDTPEGPVYEHFEFRKASGDAEQVTGYLAYPDLSVEEYGIRATALLCPDLFR